MLHHLVGLLERALNSQVTGTKPLQVHVDEVYVKINRETHYLPKLDRFPSGSFGVPVTEPHNVIAGVAVKPLQMTSMNHLTIEKMRRCGCALSAF
jgi:hypothetical protein